MYPCGLCGKWVEDGDVCWPCTNKAAAEKREEAAREIDRAMNLMIDALRFREVQYDRNPIHFGFSEVDSDMDSWVRYLEKVEEEIKEEANNE